MRRKKNRALKPHEITDRKFYRLQSGNSIYLRQSTINNCNKILSIMVERYFEKEYNKPWHMRWLLYHTKIKQYHLTYALLIMAMMKEPLINFYGAAYKNRILFKHPKIMMKVRLNSKFIARLKEERKDDKGLDT
ncbi:MAG: hypothetical protein [Siphoviridae sp. ctjeG17]|nr:MAG: hypothetical protein [Siphoviridae sp. ctjeG17]